MKKKAALYLRVSTKEQDSQSQLKDLERFCQQRGWIILRKFVDIDHGDNNDRPAYKELIDYALKGKCDVVLVWEFSRFARSMGDAVNRFEEFRERNIDFVSYHENIDTTGTYGKIVFSLMAGLAEIELQNIRARIKRGLEYAKENGTKTGNPIGRPTVDRDDVRECVRLIIERWKSPETALSPKQIQKRTVSKSTYYRIRNVVEDLWQAPPDLDLEKIRKTHKVSERLMKRIVAAFNNLHKEEVGA